MRANVSLDAALLEAIDTAAKQRGLSRSAFLASAAREKIMAGAWRSLFQWTRRAGVIALAMPVKSPLNNVI